MKTVYSAHGVKSTDGQKASLANAYKNKEAVVTRLAYEDLIGNDTLNLTSTQIKQLKKASNKQKGTDLKTSKIQICKAVPKGRSIFSSIIPMISKVASKVLPAIGLRSLMGASKVMTKKILRSGCCNCQSYMIEYNRLSELINKVGHVLTDKQKHNVMASLQTRSGDIIKPTRKQQVSSFLLVLLSMISSVLLSKVLGGSMQIGPPPPPPQVIQKGSAMRLTPLLSLVLWKSILW